MFETGDVGETPDINMQATEIPLHERLFRQLNELYSHTKNGLITIGKKVDVEILPPKKKVTILLVGNHSAGKSSFINWYIEDNVQRTGMAIETQAFSVVASGRKRETLMGPATVFLFPHLKPLEKMEGVIDYLNTEISTSKKRQFSMITFIDTPGLVDGGMEYPYNVDEAILFLGGVADLIFVFFDPVGLALCKRTMVAVERINSLYPEKLHFYLSKSDEIRKQTDKQKIMMQITQEVCRHSGLNRSGFTMPGIYIPTLARNSVVQKQACNSSNVLEKSTSQTAEAHNEIEDVCKQIDQTISRTLQTALNNLDKDITKVLQAVNERLLSNKIISDKNWIFVVFSSMTVLLMFSLLISSGLKYLTEQYGLSFMSSIFQISPDLLQPLMVPVKLLSSLSEIENKNHLFIGYSIIFLTVVIFFYFKMTLKPALPRRDVKELERLRVFIMSYMVKKKVELTEEYLQDSYDL